MHRVYTEMAHPIVACAVDGVGYTGVDSNAYGNCRVYVCSNCVQYIRLTLNFCSDHRLGFILG